MILAHSNNGTNTSQDSYDKNNGHHLHHQLNIAKHH